MSSADVLKQLSIKTQTVKRVRKELIMYEKELEQETARVNKYIEEGRDAHDIKQAENVKTESAMMIPETKQRLEAAVADLNNFLSANEADVNDTEEQKFAKEVLSEAEAMF